MKDLTPALSQRDRAEGFFSLSLWALAAAPDGGRGDGLMCQVLLALV